MSHVWTEEICVYTNTIFKIYLELKITITEWVDLQDYSMHIDYSHFPNKRRATIQFNITIERIDVKLTRVSHIISYLFSGSITPLQSTTIIKPDMNC